MKTSDKGYFASTALFFLLCSFSILNSFSSMSFSKLGSGSTAPENLRRIAHSFKLNLAVEKNSKVIEDFSESDSWIELESKLDDYAARLELHQKHDRLRQYLVMILGVTSAFFMLVFSKIRYRSQPKGHNKGRQTTASPSTAP